MLLSSQHQELLVRSGEHANLRRRSKVALGSQMVARCGELKLSKYSPAATNRPDCRTVNFFAAFLVR
jgi:hypothetical protein